MSETIATEAMSGAPYSEDARRTSRLAAGWRSTLVTGATGFIGSHVTRLLVRGATRSGDGAPESDLEPLADWR